jgi:hypothetical protein
MQVSNSEMISIMGMRHYSKMLTDLEIMTCSSLDHDYRVINGTGDELIKIQVSLISLSSDIVEYHEHEHTNLWYGECQDSKLNGQRVK